MDEFFKELNTWLEIVKNNELDRASDSGVFEEVSKEDALMWCVSCYGDTQKKIAELRKKYRV